MGIVEARSGQALETAAKLTATAEGIRSDINPVLANSAALVKDAQDSLDSNYDDMTGLLQSAVVATTQTAQAAETFNREFPKLIATAEKSNENVAGILATVNRIFAAVDAKYFSTAPLTPWGKVKRAFSIMEELFIAALRGGVF
jgi:ABC-type transporter Mla subunit MlaD